MTPAPEIDPTPEIDPPWEPPLAGTDGEQIVAALDRQRATLRWKADGLDAAGLSDRIGSSTLTLGGLLKHLALVEDYYSSTRLHGTPLDTRWDEVVADEDSDFAPSESPEELYALYDETVATARRRYAEAIAEGGCDQAVHMGIPEVGHANLRRLLLDLLEEYGRHTGHADLLRESVDGRVGEDPDPAWTLPWA
ncbi:MAG: DinB family protein [Janibacter sp.]|nr:DinB family protein [Janibacter sp.]